MGKLRTIVTGTGILIIMGTTAVLPANAATNDSIYNQLSVVRNQAGKATPMNDSKLRTLAGDRAKTLASKDSSNANPPVGLPNNMYSTGYKQSTQLWGYHSSGDSQDVLNIFTTYQKSTITESQWNRLGVGQAKSKSGKVYVVVILGEHESSVSVKPPPAPTPTTNKPKTSTGGSSNNGNTNNGTKPTAAQSKAEKELAELKAKQKKEAEARAKAESEAKKRAEADKKKAEADKKKAEAEAKAKAKAKAEQEKKDAEQRKQQEAEAKKQAEAEKLEREKQEAEREKQEAEKQAEIERLTVEKKQAEENSKTLRGNLYKLTNLAGVITTSLGTLLLPLAFLLTRKRKFARVPKDSEFEQFKKDYLANH